MDRRQQLVEESARLLSKSDGDFSIRALCAVVGVTPPTVYRYFRNREEILDAVVEDAFRRYLRQKQEKPRTGDVLEDIRAGWDLHVGFGLDNPVLHQLMFPTMDVERFHPAAAIAYRMLRDAFQRAADEGRLLAGLRADDAARAVTAAVFGVTRLLTDDPRSTTAISDAVRDGVLANLITSQSEQDPS